MEHAVEQPGEPALGPALIQRHAPQATEEDIMRTRITIIWLPVAAQ